MEKLLEIKNLTKRFQDGDREFAAVDDVSFSVLPGECVGLVGESGCGKSTIARMITHLKKPDAGSVLLEGEETVFLKGKNLCQFYGKVQMVFQNPQASFDPRRTLGDGIMESMRNQGMKKEEARQRMEALLAMVELSAEYGKRYPHEVSGGQCQRAAIARALAVKPKLLICDEATSALDVTVQAQIVKLLQKLQKETGVAILLICHDLALVQAMCDHVLVMYQGKIIEEGTPDQVIGEPREEYTKELVEAALYKQM